MNSTRTIYKLELGKVYCKKKIKNKRQNKKAQGDAIASEYSH